MSFITNVLLKIGIGFLYGLGFAVAIAIISSISLSHFSKKTVYSENEMESFKAERDLIFKEYDENAKLVPEVTKEKISVNEFTLIGALKNDGDSNWSSINLKAEIFNKNGEFIEECSEYISDNSSPGSTINFKLSCGNCSKLQLEDYHSYKLSITSASFNMK
jgi:hypothetical protein